MPVVFSDAVEAAIREVCPPRDAFDAKDFDPIEYLSTCFPDEASLALLPTFLSETNDRLRQTESELLRMVEAQALGGHDANEELTSAQQTVAELYHRVSDIKARASASEETVKELCQYIRELDIAKTNLTSGINALRSIQLWMLQLQTLASSFERKKYAHCRDALQEAQRYAAMFASLADLPKIKELNDKQTVLCRQIEFDIRNHVFADVRVDSAETKETGDGGDTDGGAEASAKETVMAEACAIVDLLGAESMKKIRDRFIDQALATYALRFRRGTDDARLERTERRYVYLRSVLVHYDSLFRHVFPRHWCVPQELCVTFCLRTKEELDWELREAGRESMDVVVLMYVLQKTIDMERELSQRLAWTEDFPGRHELPVYRYQGLILSAFKEHMDVFVRNEDKLMTEALAQPLLPMNGGQNTNHGQTNHPYTSEEEDLCLGAVLPLAEDMFVFIKESLKRTLRLAQHDVLLDMVAVWRRHLLRFAEMVTAVLPAAALTPAELRRACMVMNTAELCQTTSQDLTEEVCARGEAPARALGLDAVLEAFAALYSRAIGSVVHGLGRRLAPLLHEYGRGGFLSLDMQQQQPQQQQLPTSSSSSQAGARVMHARATPSSPAGAMITTTTTTGTSAAAAHAEVQRSMSHVSPTRHHTSSHYHTSGYVANDTSTYHLSMGGGGAAAMAQDESRLIRDMTHILHEYMLTCGSLLPANTLRFLLDKMAVSIIPRYTRTLYELRYLSEQGVAAMRVDAAALERIFLHLPNYNDPERLPSSALSSYVRLVRREFEPLQRALKVLQIDSRTETFVEVYFELTPPEERSIQDFVRLVELQGRHREDVRPWIASLSRRGVVEANRRDVALAAQAEGGGAESAGVTTVSGVMNLFGSVTHSGVHAPQSLTDGGGGSSGSGGNNKCTSRTNSGAAGGGGGFSLSGLVAQLSNSSSTNHYVEGMGVMHAVPREGGAGRSASVGHTTAFVLPSSKGNNHNSNANKSNGLVEGHAGGAGGGASAVGGSHVDKEETLGSRFASAARNTATSISFFKFNK